MKPPSNIYLIGPMGSGKTTIGRQLAKALDKDFLDCDREIEQRTGANIALIFELEGETGFRKREAALLNELGEREGVVMATGGGVVLDECNRTLLIKRGFIVYLKAPIELLVARTFKDRNRPLIQTDDPHASMLEIMEQREPLYRQVADMIVKSDHRSTRHVVAEIQRRLSAL